MGRIDHLQHCPVGEPQPAVGRSGGSLKGDPVRQEAIQRIQYVELQDGVRFLPPLLQLCIRYLNEAAYRGQPEIALIVLDQRIDTIARKAIPNCEGPLRAVFPCDHSKVCGSKDGPIGSYEQLIYSRLEVSD